MWLARSSSYLGRARPPLPPQAIEFEGSNRPRDRHGRPPPDGASFSRINDQDGQPSVALRDAQVPEHGNVSFGSRSRPYGHGRNFEDNYDREDSESAFRRPRNADMAQFNSDPQEGLRKDLDYNLQMRRFPKAAQEEKVEGMMVREENMAREPKYTGTEMDPSLDIRRPENEDKSVGSGYPSGQTYAPRGPRAMHSSVDQDEDRSPIPQSVFGPGTRGGNLERSPPPHLGNRGRENGGWREERGGHMFERGVSAGGRELACRRLDLSLGTSWSIQRLFSPTSVLRFWTEQRTHWKSQEATCWQWRSIWTICAYAKRSFCI